LFFGCVGFDFFPGLDLIFVFEQYPDCLFVNIGELVVIDLFEHIDISLVGLYKPNKLTGVLVIVV
jgi:hypothetical protein